VNNTGLRPALGFVHSTTRYWWLLLITGVLWMVIAVMILRFNPTSVATVAILFGVYCWAAAANEVAVGAMSSRGWRVVHWALTALFVLIGVLAFVQPGATFVSLAAVMSIYFVFRGAVDVAKAISIYTVPAWWVLLLVGVAELVIGFWAARSFNASVVVLVSWVAAAAMVHGVGQIGAAFMARDIDHGVAAVREHLPVR